MKFWHALTEWRRLFTVRRPNRRRSGTESPSKRSRSGNPVLSAQVESVESRVMLAGTTWEVNTTLDIYDPTGTVLSLRQAIENANLDPERDTVRFASHLNGHTVRLSLGELQISGDLTITGLGSSVLAIDGGWDGTAAGNSGSRIFRIDSGIDVSLSGVTLTRGRNSFGGAISNEGNLTLSNAVIEGNFASSTSTNSDDSHGAGIYNLGNLSLNAVSIRNNQSMGSGGGVANHGTLISQNSTFSGNRANAAGAVLNSALMIATNDTFAGNSAESHGGGIVNRGTLTTVHVTIADNGVDLQTGGGLLNDGTWNSINTIVANNHDGDVRFITGSILNLHQTMIGDNSVGDLDLTSGSGNFFHPTEQNFFQSAMLTENGGPTQTIALAKSSPAWTGRGVLARLVSGISSSEVVAEVTNSTYLALGQRLRIDDEIVLVTGIAGSTITLRREFAETAGRAHPADSEISLAFDQRNFLRSSGSLGAVAGGITSILVTSSGDAHREGRTTLREAVSQANLDDHGTQITYSEDLGRRTTFVTNGPIHVTGDMSVAGIDLLRTTISGRGTQQIFVIEQTADVTLSGMTLRNGHGSLGGAILNHGRLRFLNGAIQNSDAERGGGVYNAGTLEVINSTIQQNTATVGGGVANAGTFHADQTTISLNSADTRGGGVWNSGDFRAANSTIARNAARYRTGGGVFNSGTFTSLHLTIAGNLAPTNGGVHTPGVWNSRNTIVAANSGGDVGAQTLFDNGHGSIDAQNTLIGDSSLNGLSWVTGSDNLLHPLNQSIFVTDLQGIPLLASNGGPTATIALAPGSPAINAGRNSLTTDSFALPVTDDQRGTGFDRFVGGTPDLGAYERNLAPTDMTLSVSTIAERSDNGTLIGEIHVVDQDRYESISLDLLDSAGGRFVLSGTQLLVADGSLLNAAVATSHTIRLRATDGIGQQFEKSLTITVARSQFLGNVLATVSGRTVILRAGRSHQGNDIEIISSLNGITLIGHNGTTINGAASKTFPATDSIQGFANSSLLPDRIRVTGVARTVSFNLWEGNNSVTFENFESRGFVSVLATRGRVAFSARNTLFNSLTLIGGPVGGHQVAMNNVTVNQATTLHLHGPGAASTVELVTTTLKGSLALYGGSPLKAAFIRSTLESVILWTLSASGHDITFDGTTVKRATSMSLLGTGSGVRIDNSTFIGSVTLTAGHNATILIETVNSPGNTVFSQVVTVVVGRQARIQIRAETTTFRSPARLIGIELSSGPLLRSETRLSVSSTGGTGGTSGGNSGGGTPNTPPARSSVPGHGTGALAAVPAAVVTTFADIQVVGASIVFTPDPIVLVSTPPDAVIAAAKALNMVRPNERAAFDLPPEAMEYLHILPDDIYNEVINARANVLGVMNALAPVIAESGGITYGSAGYTALLITLAQDSNAGREARERFSQLLVERVLALAAQDPNSLSNDDRILLGAIEGRLHSYQIQLAYSYASQWQQTKDDYAREHSGTFSGLLSSTVNTSLFHPVNPFTLDSGDVEGLNSFMDRHGTTIGAAAGIGSAAVVAGIAAAAGGGIASAALSGGTTALTVAVSLGLPAGTAASAAALAGPVAIVGVAFAVLGVEIANAIQFAQFDDDMRSVVPNALNNPPDLHNLVSTTDGRTSLTSFLVLMTQSAQGARF